ncbi:MAG: FtsX-like permease family protein [Peptococcaceae bacterium]|nr:FtsX-like permease family protein [Peptococcaceae bacterium]
MGKLSMHAFANIRRARSVSFSLVFFFVIAAFLLNAGLLVVVNYGGFFAALKEELLPADAYFLLPDVMYTEGAEAAIKNNRHVRQTQHHELIRLDAEIVFQDKAQTFNVLLANMDEPRGMSQWKYVGKHLAQRDMGVYVPDIFRTAGYQLDDKIELRYVDKDSGANNRLVFTVKGYTEDIFFSSRATGSMSFYLPEGTWKRVGEILEDPAFRAHVVFANVDDVKNVQGIERGVREALEAESIVFAAEGAFAMPLSADLILIENARCVMTIMIASMIVVFALIVVFVCMLVVRFRIMNSVEEDIVKIGSLKSVGYTNGQIVSSVLLQFLLISGLGSLFGVVLSYPALPFVSTVLEQQSGLKWEQGVDGQVSLMALLAIGIIVVAVSWLAARRINKLAPSSALRKEVTTRTFKKNRLPLEGAKGRLSSLMAFKSILQNMRQHIMIAFIVVSVTFAGAYGVIMYYNTTVDTKAFAEVPGMELCNVIVQLNPELDQSTAVREIERLAVVRKTLYLEMGRVTVEGQEAGAFVMEDYAKKESLQVYKGRYPKSGKEIVLAGILAEKLGKVIGDKVSVGYGQNKETFTVVGLSNGSAMGGENVSVLAQDYRQLNPHFRFQSLYVYLDKGTDAEEVISDVKILLDKEMLLGVTNFDKELADNMASYQSVVAAMGIIMLATTAFVVWMVLYFIINASITRKKKELGIQKAVGYTTFQLMNQLSIGVMIPIAIGAVTGSFLGAVFTNPLMSMVMKGMGMMKAGFIVDPLWVMLFGVTTVILSYFLSLLISSRIRRISPYQMVME